MATFEVATGAAVGGPSVGVTADSYALAVSSDLRFAGPGFVIGSQRRRLGHRCRPWPTSLSGTWSRRRTTPPLAVDPVQPIVAFQVGQGSITLADWAQVGALTSHPSRRSGRIAGPVALSPAGAPVGLARPLRLLGLPLQASPQEPWFAMASNTGPAAILSSSGIAIWDPTTRPHHPPPDRHPERL